MVRGYKNHKTIAFDMGILENMLLGAVSMGKEKKWSLACSSQQRKKTVTIQTLHAACTIYL